MHAMCFWVLLYLDHTNGLCIRYLLRRWGDNLHAMPRWIIMQFYSNHGAVRGRHIICAGRGGMQCVRIGFLFGGKCHQLHAMSRWIIMQHYANHGAMRSGHIICVGRGCV